MAFQFVQPASLPLIAAAEAGETKTGWDLAARTLRADYERWSRWGMGWAAYAMTIIGILVTVTGIAGLLAGDNSAGDRVAVLALSVIFAAPMGGGGYLLWRLHRSGRALSRAAARWLRYPYEIGVRRPTLRGWYEPRLVNYEPAFLARIINSALAALMGISGITAALWGPTSDLPGIDVAFGAVGVVSVCCAAGQFGGIQRIVNALAMRDPIWRFLRRG